MEKGGNMPIDQQDQDCARLVEKIIRADFFNTNESLNAAEKAHLSQCPECMREVVLNLDLAAEDAAGLLGTKPELATGELSPDVMQALEQGKRIFAREFGS